MPELSYQMWHGLYVVKGTPKPAIEALNGALAQSGRRSGNRGEAEAARNVPFPDKDMTPDAHAKLFVADLPRVAKLVESAGIAVTEAK